MLGEYSIMDWVTLGGILATLASLIGSIITLVRDNNMLKAEIKALSKENDRLTMEHNGLSKEHNGLSKEHDDLSKEHSSIKKDTEFVVNVLRDERRARESLYENTPRAKEILDTMDMMKEVVNKNAQLSEEVSALRVTNNFLQEKVNQHQDNSTKLVELQQLLSRVSQQLSSMDDYRRTEEVRSILSSMETKLGNLNNQL